jgi:hypothetical protein
MTNNDAERSEANYVEHSEANDAERSEANYVERSETNNLLTINE